jgi:CheY-like chemotaxis protein
MDSLGTILLVEDNDDDVFFMQRALKVAAVPNPLQIVQDGQAAIDYLAGAGDYADRSKFQFPCLVFLDMKLPRKTGHEVLAWLRSQKQCATLIVIALTTSREAKDITLAYELGVNAYLVKPTSPTQLTDLMIAFRNFWIVHNIVE